MDIGLRKLITMLCGFGANFGRTGLGAHITTHATLVLIHSTHSRVYTNWLNSLRVIPTGTYPPWFSTQQYFPSINGTFVMLDIG